jgi:hypothetical protein
MLGKSYIFNQEGCCVKLVTKQQVTEIHLNNGDPDAANQSTNII